MLAKRSGCEQAVMGFDRRTRSAGADVANGLELLLL